MFAARRTLRWSILSLIVIVLILFTETVSAQSQPPGDMVSNPILGVQKILFIRIKYPDNNQVILSAQRAPIHANELAAIIEANSYGKLKFDIDITPILTMPQPTSFYELEDRQALIRIRADALKIAEDAGFQVSDYDREAIFTKRLWPQKAFLGIGGVNMRTIYTSLDNAVHTAHEFGHSFDWRHANFWRVTSGNPLDTAGVKIEYGDKFDIMGDTRNFHHFNPFFKFRAGWLPQESILTVSESGIYFIRALEKPPLSGATVNEYSALRIRKNPDTEYWVYYRSREDSTNAGAMISQIKPQNTSQALLLDMTPGSRPEKRDHKDAALVPGKAIKDLEAGIEITVLEKNDDSLRIQVIVPGDQIDTLPVIDIISPASGKTVKGGVEYEVTAYDPDMGNVNGAGIDTVKFILGYSAGDDPWGEGLTFVVVAEKTVTSPPYVFHVETDSLPDEAYRLGVGAISQNGGMNSSALSHLIDNTGPSVPTSVAQQQVAIVHNFQLQQNYPNPFNPSTTISYSVERAGEVELRIYNMLGQKVRTLVQGMKSAGDYAVVWDGRDDLGRQMPSGQYSYRFKADERQATRAMILLK